MSALTLNPFHRRLGVFFAAMNVRDLLQRQFLQIHAVAEDFEARLRRVEHFSEIRDVFGVVNVNVSPDGVLYWHREYVTQLLAFFN